MNSYRTPAIILHRTNYREADRILTILTPQHGKVSAIARGVRRPKSKLAGGLELFAICDLTIMEGRGDLGIITSARMENFYGKVLRSYEHLQLGYEMLKRINRATETIAEEEFFLLLHDGLLFLGDERIDRRLVEVWFRLKLANLLGRGLNVSRTASGDLLQAEQLYNFDFAENSFVAHPSGKFSAAHIKVLRLLLAKNPAVVGQVSGVDALLDDCLWLARSLE